MKSFDELKGMWASLGSEILSERLTHLPENEDGSILATELLVTYQELENIFQSHNSFTDEGCLEFQQFLVDRWERIHNTPLAYTDLYNHCVTTFCVELAQAIFPQLLAIVPGADDEKCYHQLLMPTLQNLRDASNGTLLKNCAMHTFVVSGDGTAFIPIIDTFEYWLGSDEKDPFRLNQTNLTRITLTKSEQNSIRLHSLDSEKCYHSIAIYQRRLSMPSAATAMRRLVSGLRETSVRGSGTEFQTDITVFRHINIFKEFLENCSEADRNKILDAKAEGSIALFRRYWNRLIIENPSTSNAMTELIDPNQLASELTADLCISVISTVMENIVNSNPYLENIFPESEISNKLLASVKYDIQVDAAEIKLSATRKMAACSSAYAHSPENPLQLNVKKLAAQKNQIQNLHETLQLSPYCLLTSRHQRFFPKTLTTAESNCIFLMYFLKDSLKRFNDSLSLDNALHHPVFLITLLYTLCIRNEINPGSYVMAIDVQNTTVTISEPNSGAELVIPKALFESVFTNLPSYLNLLLDVEQKKALLIQMLTLYIEHRELTLSAKGNNYLSVLHLRGYVGERKIGAAQELIDLLKDTTKPVPLHLLRILKQGTLSGVYNAYEQIIAAGGEKPKVAGSYFSY